MIFLYFIFGLFIGSFLNMLIDRMPREEQIVKGRSHCDRCNHVLSWQDLVPVISWSMLRGKCRYCHKPVPFRNTLVELTTGVLFAINYLVLTNYIDVFSTSGLIAEVLMLIILCCLVVIFFIDFDHQIIPDSLTIVATLAATILHIVEPTVLSIGMGFSFQNYIAAALSAALFFIFLIAITRGRGMGWGDVKFALFMGIFLGYPRIVFSLYFAFLTGAFVSAILIVRRRKKFGQTIPFGPFLIVGTLFAAFGTLDIAWEYLFGSPLQ